MSAIYQSNVSVRCVLGSLRPWLILPGTSSSITLYISTDFSLKWIHHTIYTCTRPVLIVCRRPPYFHPRPLMITIWYCNDIDSPFKVHRDCLGAGPWLNQTERKYDSSEMMINYLIK